jgi:hypothetical protein
LEFFGDSHFGIFRHLPDQFFRGRIDDLHRVVLY